jgi:hypothetical protein
MMINFKEKKEFFQDKKDICIHIACFTTTWARLKLYNDRLEPLQERVLYFDTDSVIYTKKKLMGLPDEKEEIDLPVGKYLGDFTNELKPKGDYITKFVASAPKSYGYITKSGKTSMKVKGFTLSFRNKNILGFEKMKDMIIKYVDNFDPKDKAELTDDFNILRTKKRKLQSRVLRKDFSINYDKRQIRKPVKVQTQNDFEFKIVSIVSQPWGF